MTKLDKLKQEQLQARKSYMANKAILLSTLLGEVQTQMKNSTKGEDELVESSAKSMYKAVEDTKAENYKEELRWLRPYLPQTMSKDEIKSILDTLDFSNASNFGAKMGMAMKALEGKADGNDVRLVIQENYI